MARESRLAYAALGFGLAAALACWNPLAAPFGLVVGLASVVLSVRALRRGVRRPFAAAGLALSVLAVGASALVLALTAGIGRDLSGQPVVAGPSREEATRTLDAAAERTRAARERARTELDQIDGKPAGGKPRESAPGR
ncbi:hypothetical protein [Anaeromyxobacter oryzae]|uniref:DUF4190 domain-containing protein n=1 Tax=Anaeromyxobacter oryzae TaxID=2918170 RepID=A0ABM7X4R5_9BACT|nr:hypothetical protein [Anaeromyxobacter oryzae]BDG06802.1 hypothetical protein AMOR_57980 [Anaeromyxobacter oryzae]